MIAPLPKIKAILLYFYTNTDPKFLGKVKLMKLFYYLDFTHVKTYGSPVTFDTYINLEHGPIPTIIKNLVDTVEDDIDSSELIDTIRIEKSNDRGIHRVIATRSFAENDKKYFSEIELETLEKVCARFGNKTARFIENSSHKEAPWRKTNLADEIPYTLATEDKDCLVDKEIIELSLSI